MDDFEQKRLFIVYEHAFYVINFLFMYKICQGLIAVETFISFLLQLVINVTNFLILF